MKFHFFLILPTNWFMNMQSKAELWVRKGISVTGHISEKFFYPLATNTFLHFCSMYTRPEGEAEALSKCMS